METMTIEKRTAKNGRTYYYETLEYGIKGEPNYELMYSGKSSKSQWEWINNIAEEQEARLIVRHNDYIAIYN